MSGFKRVNMKLILKSVLYVLFGLEIFRIFRHRRVLYYALLVSHVIWLWEFRRMRSGYKGSQLRLRMESTHVTDQMIEEHVV